MKTQRSYKLMVLLLSLIMIVGLLPITAFAEDIKDVTNTGLDLSVLPTVETTYKAGDGTIKYDPNTSTLTLDNATILGTDFNIVSNHTAIQLPAKNTDINIKINGTFNVNNCFYAIKSVDTGSGETVNANISGGTIHMENGETVLATMNIILDNVKIEAVKNGTNVITSNNVFIKNSVIDATVNDEYGVGTGAINSNNTVQITNSKINLDITSAAGARGITIRDYDLAPMLKIENSTVDISANGTTSSAGIRVWPTYNTNDATIDFINSDVTITSTGDGVLMCRNSSDQGKDMFTVSGGNLSITAGSERVAIYSYNHTSDSFTKFCNNANINLNGANTTAGIYTKANVIVEDTVRLTSSSPNYASVENFDLSNYSPYYSMLVNSYSALATGVSEWDRTTALSTYKYIKLLPAGNLEIKNDISKVYDGNPVNEPVYVKESTADSTVEYKAKDADDTTYTTTAPTNAGSYTVRVSVKANDVYAAMSATKDFTISKKAVTVTPDSFEKVYGDKDEELTYKAEGVVDGESLENITLSREDNENVGKYDITATQTDGANANYEITFEKGVYEITPRDISSGTVVLGKALIDNGEEQTQEVEKVILDDYDVTFDVSGNTADKAGTFTLTVTGNGNFKGSIEKKFVVIANNDKVDEIGKIDVAVKKDEKAPETKLETDKATMVQITASAEELSKVAGGDELDIWLEVRDATDKVSSETKKLIADKAGDFKVGAYLDIDLYKKLVSEADATKITETDKPIKIVITIPSNLLDYPENISREFSLVRVHNGVAEVIPTVFDKTGGTLTFETDRFSDYAITYKDTEINDDKSTDPTNPSKDDKTPNNGNKDMKSPQTGDNSNILVWTITMMLSGACMLMIIFIERKKKYKAK